MVVVVVVVVMGVEEARDLPAAFFAGGKPLRAARGPESTFPPLRVRTTPNGGFNSPARTSAAASSRSPTAAPVSSARTSASTSFERCARVAGRKSLANISNAPGAHALRLAFFVSGLSTLDSRLCRAVIRSLDTRSRFRWNPESRTRFGGPASRRSDRRGCLVRGRVSGGSDLHCRLRSSPDRRRPAFR